MSKSSQQEDVLGKFIEEKEAAQKQREQSAAMYGLTFGNGSGAPGMGGGTGVSLKPEQANKWGPQISFENVPPLADYSLGTGKLPLYTEAAPVNMGASSGTLSEDAVKDLLAISGRDESWRDEPPIQLAAGKGFNMGASRRTVAMKEPNLSLATADELQQQGESKYKQAKILSDAAKWASSKGSLEDAAAEYAQKAREATAAGDEAINMAGRINIAKQAAEPKPGANWSYMGQNSVGYVQGRGIAPDYASINLSSHTLTGTVSTNLYDGTIAYGGGVNATNVDPGFQLTPSASVGWIFGVNDAKGVTNFITGSGTQFNITIPTIWRASPTIGINHSYGGAWALELGVTPSVGRTIFSYQPYGELKETGK